MYLQVSIEHITKLRTTIHDSTRILGISRVYRWPVFLQVVELRGYAKKSYAHLNRHSPHPQSWYPYLQSLITQIREPFFQGLTINQFCGALHYLCNNEP